MHIHKLTVLISLHLVVSCTVGSKEPPHSLCIVAYAHTPELLDACRGGHYETATCRSQELLPLCSSGSDPSLLAHLDPGSPCKRDKIRYFQRAQNCVAISACIVWGDREVSRNLPILFPLVHQGHVINLDNTNLNQSLQCLLSWKPILPTDKKVQHATSKHLGQWSGSGKRKVNISHRNSNTSTTAHCTQLPVISPMGSQIVNWKQGKIQGYRKSKILHAVRLLDPSSIPIFEHSIKKGEGDWTALLHYWNLLHDLISLLVFTLYNKSWEIQFWRFTTAAVVNATSTYVMAEALHFICQQEIISLS